MKMTHPNTDRTITVADNMAGIYRTQGWREVTAEPAEEPAKKPAAPRRRKK